jgi:hypothetical protein
MKFSEAIAKGYASTGCTDLSDKDEFAKAKERFKKAGYKTATVNERCSGRSRGSAGIAYRVLYVERRYRDDELIKSLEQELAALPARAKNAEDAFKAELQSIAERGVELETKIARLKAEHNTFLYPSLSAN